MFFVPYIPQFEGARVVCKETIGEADVFKNHAFLNSMGRRKSYWIKTLDKNRMRFSNNNNMMKD